MKLILIRHGETEENKAWIIQWHLPGKLSPLWILQAQKLAERLKDEKFDFIYSSDLKRASDTAKEIVKYHIHTPLEFTQELRERSYWGLEWRRKQEIEEEALKENKDIWSYQKGWESSEELLKRANDFLEKIVTRHKNDTILFIWHGHITKALITIMQWEGGEEMRNMKDLENTSVFIYEIDENKNYKEILFNCTKHLD